MEHAYDMEYHGARMNAAQAEERLHLERKRPFHLLRPKLYPDGDMWCCLYGDDLQEGVAGFGETPEKASIDFDINFLNQKLKTSSPSVASSSVCTMKVEDLEKVRAALDAAWELALVIGCQSGLFHTQGKAINALLEEALALLPTAPKTELGGEG